MSSENSWIPWNKRDELKQVFLKICYKETLFYNNTHEFIYRLGRVPSEYLERLCDSIDNILNLFCSNEVFNDDMKWDCEWIKFQDEISPEDEENMIRDLMFYNEYKAVKETGKDSEIMVIDGKEVDMTYYSCVEELIFDVYTEIINSKLYLENFDNELFLHRKNLLPTDNVLSEVPAFAPVDETSRGRTVIDEKLKYDIGVFIKENPNCSNRAIARKFSMGTGTISSNPELKAFIERCRSLNIQSIENNPNFDNDPFSNGRGRRNE